MAKGCNQFKKRRNLKHLSYHLKAVKDLCKVTLTLKTKNVRAGTLNNKMFVLNRCFFCLFKLSHLLK